MVTTLLANQNQVSVSDPQPSNTLVPPPVSSAPLNAAQLTMPEGCPWGMPTSSFGEESRPVVSEIPRVQLTMPIPQLGNIIPQVTATVPAPVV
ncbi:hypothetical protein A2U01_0067181, partial [Trifolium medium]|nr:hypothetical protein [Trifolium medium]